MVFKHLYYLLSYKAREVETRVSFAHCSFRTSFRKGYDDLHEVNGKYVNQLVNHDYSNGEFQKRS